jgi:hypothetical protein
METFFHKLDKPHMSNLQVKFNLRPKLEKLNHKLNRGQVQQATKTR